MSRKNNSKGRANFNHEIERILKNYNTKIERVTKKNPDIAQYQPQKISVKQFKEKIETKNYTNRDIKRELKSLQRYSNKGAELPTKAKKTGHTTTRWERKEIGYKVATINRQRTRDRKIYGELEATSFGEDLGYKRNQMGSERNHAYDAKPYNFDSMKGGVSWKKFVESVDKQVLDSYTNERMELYKQNYIKAVYNNLGEYGEDLIKIIEQIPAKDVVKTYYQEEQADIQFIYPDYTFLANDFKMEALNSIWNSALQSSLPKGNNG